MKYLIVVLLIALTFTSCSVSSNNDESSSNEISEQSSNGSEESMTVVYQKITPEQAKELMVDGNIILDIRTKEEYDSGYIPGAILLPLDQILMGNLDLLPDKDQIILVYCRSGNRSETAARELVDEGFNMVYDFGGIIDWSYETVK